MWLCPKANNIILPFPNLIYWYVCVCGSIVLKPTWFFCPQILPKEGAEFGWFGAWQPFGVAVWLAAWVGAGRYE